MESSLFGLLYVDEDRRASPEILAPVAATMGVRGAAIQAEGPFAVGLYGSFAGGRRKTASIAIGAERPLWVAVTGDIHNRGRLNNSLARDERPAGDAGDGALVLALFRKHGASFIACLEGCFNIAIWNIRHRELTLFTDRCGGIRPIYYYLGREFLVFGSTAKAVVAHSRVPREVDPVGLDQMFAFAHPIAPRTLFKGVSVLPGGTFLRCCRGQAEIGRYWQRTPFRDTGEDAESLSRRYFKTLEGAVERVIDKRSELGVFLSGGVDSAALVSLIRRAGCDRLKTFFVNTGDAADGDREATRRIVELYRTEHRTLDVLDAECLQLLPEMVWYYESPGQSFHPTYLLCREAGNYCDVVVAGHGNDLVWGTVPPLFWANTWPLRSLPVVALLGYARKRRLLPRNAARRLRAESPATDLGLLAAVSGYAVRTGNLVTDFICLDESLFGDQRVYRELGKFAFDAHSLRVLTPYTDAAVIEVAESVPPDARFRSRYNEQTRFKGFFKDVMNQHRVLPTDIIYRRKAWMRSPMAEWLRGDFGVIVGDILLGGRSGIRNFFDSDVVARAYREHRSGAADRSYVLAMLTAFEIWHRIFIDPPAIRSPGACLSDFRESAR